MKFITYICVILSLAALASAQRGGGKGGDGTRGNGTMSEDGESNGMGGGKGKGGKKGKNETMEFASDLNCGKCLKGGWGYCFEGTDGAVLDTEAASECCETEEGCASSTSSSYTCSFGYENKEFRMTFCPSLKSKCGEKQNFEFAEGEEGETEEIEVSGLEQGESCNFKVKTECGAPGFEMLPKSEDGSDDSEVNVDRMVSITYVEFDSELALEESEDGFGKKPPRNSTMKSEKKSKADGSAISGKYNSDKKGTKIFGSKQQKSKGEKSSKKDSDCEEREMLITVTATEDIELNKLSLEVGAFEIKNPSESKKKEPSFISTMTFGIFNW